jgi:hypothetical protein
MHIEKYLSPAEAEHYLEQKGLKRKRSTLSKLRCIGGGPKFVTYGRSPKYTEPWLDEYVASQLSAPKRSTSEVA